MSLVEGPKRKNTQGNDYRAMFLVRRFKVDGETQSDIATFRVSPKAGVGWITAPDKGLTPNGDYEWKQTIAIGCLSPKRDATTTTGSRTSRRAVSGWRKPLRRRLLRTT